MKIEVDAGAVALTPASSSLKKHEMRSRIAGNWLWRREGPSAVGYARSGFKRIAADLSKQRPTVVAIVTPTPIGGAKEHPNKY